MGVVYEICQPRPRLTFYTASHDKVGEGLTPCDPCLVFKNQLVIVAEVPPTIYGA